MRESEKFTPVPLMSQRRASESLCGANMELEFSSSHDMRGIFQARGEVLMAKLVAPYLFTWKDVGAKSDLERLMLVLEHLPDERLMQTLEEQRKWGRDDYPIRPVWNSVLAGVVYQHGSIESLRRELLRNGELRQLCGFDPHKGSGAVFVGLHAVFEVVVQIQRRVGWDV